MNLCSIHNVPLKPLFTSFYCPMCDGVTQFKFEELTPQLQRIWIAEDVLARLKRQSLYPYRGIFIQKEDDTCYVCALGALTVSCLSKQSNVSLDFDFSVNRGGGEARTTIHRFLSPYFSSEQLDLIEAAFEEESCFALNWNPKLERARNLYGSEVLDEGEKLKRIMQNIIDNQGMFVVE